MTDLQSSYVTENKTKANYKIVKAISSGWCGTVYEATDIKGNTVAIKKMCVTKPLKRGNTKIKNVAYSAFWELEIMKYAKHPNVVRYIDSYIETDTIGQSYICIVMEYYPLTMKSIYNKHHDDNTYLRWSRELISAAVYLRSIGILHLDIKPGNIFFRYNSDTKDYKLVLGDLGRFSFINDSSTGDEPPMTEVKHFTSAVSGWLGDIPYRAPEQYTTDGKPLTEERMIDDKCVVWALGMNIYEMFITSNPLHKLSDAEAKKYIHDNLLFDKSIDFMFTKTSGIIIKLLIIDPYWRPTLYDIAKDLKIEVVHDASKVVRYNPDNSKLPKCIFNSDIDSENYMIPDDIKLLEEYIHST